MHGHGVQTDPHGNLFEGEWRDGKPVLKDKMQHDKCARDLGYISVTSRLHLDCISAVSRSALMAWLNEAVISAISRLYLGTSLPSLSLRHPRRPPDIPLIALNYT